MRLIDTAPSRNPDRKPDEATYQNPAHLEEGPIRNSPVSGTADNRQDSRSNHARKGAVAHPLMLTLGDVLTQVGESLQLRYSRAKIR